MVSLDDGQRWIAADPGAAAVALVLALALLLGLLAACLIAIRRLRERSGALRDALAAIERGDLAHRIPPRDGVDGHDLASAFNRMAERLDAAATAQRQAFDELRRAYDRERLTRDLIGLGTWRYDLRTGRVHVDESLAAMLGDTPESYGQYVEAFDARVHPDDLDRVWAKMDEYLEPDRGLPRYESEFRMRHRDGSWRWMASFGRVIECDEQGRPCVLAGAQYDVTDRHLARARVASR